jgi:hypothetical protein
MTSRLYAVPTGVSTVAVAESREQAIYNAGWLMKVWNLPCLFITPDTGGSGALLIPLMLFM